ncbi:MAG: OmpA family protein [Cyclobacteriaceae bacterium]
MLKIALRLSLVLFIFQANAQVSTDTLVSVSGKVLSAKDSSLVSASILYEKLPYYDDMGMITSSANGTFEVPLVKGSTYNFSITKTGFTKYDQEIVIAGSSALTQSEEFYLPVDEIELIKLENLIFPSGRATISSESHNELDELAVWMNGNPTIVIQLEGHTDFRGNPTANMQLSEARVVAVKEYLVDQKVKKARILTKAFGGTQPLSRDDTTEAKTLNRRVEVRVIRR